MVKNRDSENFKMVQYIIVPCLEQEICKKMSQNKIPIIKRCATEIDQDIIIKMFDNLKNRIHLANENGLESLL